MKLTEQLQIQAVELRAALDKKTQAHPVIDTKVNANNAMAINYFTHQTTIAHRIERKWVSLLHNLTWLP